MIGRLPPPPPNSAHLLPEAGTGPGAPSCTGPLCPDVACRTEPPRKSAWAGSRRRHTSSLGGRRPGAGKAVRLPTSRTPNRKVRPGATDLNPAPLTRVVLHDGVDEFADAQQQ